MTVKVVKKKKENHTSKKSWDNKRRG